MTRSTSFIILSLLLVVGQTSALLNVAPCSQRNSVVSSSCSSLRLCPGEGKILVDAFNEAVANANIEDASDLQSSAEQLHKDIANAVAEPAHGLLHRLKHALGTVGTTEEEINQDLLP